MQVLSLDNEGLLKYEEAVQVKKSTRAWALPKGGCGP